MDVLIGAGITGFCLWVRLGVLCLGFGVVDGFLRCVVFIWGGVLVEGCFLGIELGFGR